MKIKSVRRGGWAFLFALALGFSSNGNALASSCVGICGTATTTDGVVTIPPGFSSIGWISTHGGTTGAGQLPGVGGTNGTTFTSDSFHATAGQVLQFFFNYITSDGSQFADYAWVQLQTTSLTPVALLLTA